jgi:hypothetical protein
MNQIAISCRLKDMIDSGTARELRLKAGDTFAVAGRAIEVDPATVLHWERGTRTPRGRNVAAYYRYLTRLAAQCSGAGSPA